MPQGDDIGGFAVTGRKLVGPAADLVELDSPRGLRHTAIAFHPEYRGHEAIGSALDVVVGFLESPMVTGLVELVAVDRAQGAFVYPTGEAWSVAEVIRVLADLGEPAGVRAGLELMYATGQILVEAADAGDSQGVYSHGGLTPWRVLLKRDGQVLVIGHALPQVEILQFHADPRRVPREDSFRYCPPERIEARAEDLSSDLFSLALIGFELMTGKPVYDGLVTDIRQQAARGEGSRRLFRFREVLPQTVRDVMGWALRPGREDRYPSGDDFLESLRGVLSGREATGPSLADVMARVAASGQRTGTALEGGKTQMLSKDQILAMLDEEQGGPRGSGDGVQGRSAGKTWSPPPDRARRSSRRTREEEAQAAAPAPVAAPPAAPAPAASAPVRVSVSPPAALAPPAPAPVAAPVSAPVSDPVSAPVTGPTGPRWSKVTRGAARPAPASPEAPAPAAPTGPASSGDRARELLAWIRSSADKTEAPPPAAEPGPPRAQALVDRIKAGSEPPPVVPPPPAAAPPDEDGPRFEAGRARRSKRTPSAGEGPPPIPSPLVTIQVSPPAPEAPPKAPEPPPKAPEPPPKAPEPPPKAPELPPKAPEPPPKAPEPPPLAEGAPRPPDAIPPDAGGEPLAIQLVRGPGVRPVRVRLPADMTTAAVVARLVGNVLPVRTDLSGAITGWWRLAQDGRRLPAATTVAEIGAERPVTLVQVDNVQVLAELHIGHGDPPLRFQARVGTAVPASTLVDHLAAWHGLPPGRWILSCEGQDLGPHDLLADVLPSGPTGRVRLQVRAGDP